MLSQVSILQRIRKDVYRILHPFFQKENINIWGPITNDSAEYGIIRMVVSNP